MLRSIVVSAIMLAVLGTARGQGLEGLELQKALKDEAAGFWIYDDIAEGFRVAEKTGKPLIISFRCVP